jgi:hypothetical protein
MNAVRKQCWATAMTVAVLLLAGCSQPTKPAASNEAEAKKEPTGPAEPVTAKTALWPMYTSARSWATDFVILKLTRKEVAGVKDDDPGKAAVWQATFASPSRHEYRVYTYAIAAYPPDIYKGVAVGEAIPWGGETRDVMPIGLSQFNVDSDAAYKTATTDAAVWLKKNPDKKLATFELGNAYRFPEPVWFLMWGNKKSGYTAFVNANDGKVLKGK